MCTGPQQRVSTTMQGGVDGTPSLMPRACDPVTHVHAAAPIAVLHADEPGGHCIALMPLDAHHIEACSSSRDENVTTRILTHTG
jgi:hypothetical protein